MTDYQNIIKILKKRKLIEQIINENKIKKKIKNNKIVVYCGFDPTANSLHLGHLIPLICLKEFKDQGHKTIALIGGATGIIGDPSFRKNERKINNFNEIKLWSRNIKKQISKFLNFNPDQNNTIILDNYSWFKNFNLIKFLCEVGRNFSINNMINKECIKTRLNDVNNKKLSFTEFSYILMQSYDFYYLNENFNATLQIGGSDQWGNILSGIDLIKKLKNKKTFGITLPLITNKKGEKFGKTGDNTIWLDSKKTSPYKFYQFWINVSDENVFYFLQIFSNITIKEKKIKKPRFYQNILAEKMTLLIHGKKGLKSAKRITNSLFLNNFNLLKVNDFQQLIQDGMLNIILDNNEDIPSALVKAKLALSRNQAKNMINSHAISINGKKQSHGVYSFDNTKKIFNQYTLLCRGKKNYCLIQWK